MMSHLSRFNTIPLWNSGLLKTWPTPVISLLNRSATSVCVNDIQNRSFHVSAANPSKELLAQSAVPTYHFQPTLPRLPVPTLEDTCARYLTALQPLVPPQQLQSTTKVVEAFKNGPGQDLHAQILQYDHTHPDTNYVAGFWSDVYLKARDSVMLNFSIGLLLRDDPRPLYQKQDIRATNFIVSALRFMKTLESEKLEPYSVPAKPSPANRHLLRFLPKVSTTDATPLKTVLPVDMSQFNNMYRSTRIPSPERDRLVTFPDSKHITVLKNGHFYTFDVLDKNGNILPGEDILGCLQHIQQETCPPPDHPVCVLTTDHRDTWMAARHRLEQAGNQESLRAIDSAIMMVVLDEGSSDINSVLKASLHGNGANRWFDKAFNLAISPEGSIPYLLEHSWADGMTTVYQLNMAARDCMNNPAVAPDTRPTAEAGQAVRKIDFNLTEEIKSDIQESMKRFKTSVGQLQQQATDFQGYGAKYIKSKKISPDALIQLAYQIAYQRLHNENTPVYESCTTSIFKHGRTETMRPATMATKKMCDLIDAQNRPSNDEFMSMLQECSKMHGKLAGAASMGQGFDRHLLALRKTAELRGETPEIFTDPSYMDSLMFRLCTSTLGSATAMKSAIFAPVVPDGYGIAYLVEAEHIHVSTTTYQSRDTAQFMDCLAQTLTDLHTLMEGRDFK